KTAVILRPLSEMNDSSAGSWCFDNWPENTPTNYATVWVALRSIMRRSGAMNAYFVLAPAVWGDPPKTDDPVIATVNEIRGKDPKAIDAIGMDVYSPEDGDNPQPLPFADIVNPWHDHLNSLALPFVVPEMGVNRSRFRDDSKR